MTETLVIFIPSRVTDPQALFLRLLGISSDCCPPHGLLETQLFHVGRTQEKYRGL